VKEIPPALRSQMEEGVAKMKRHATRLRELRATCWLVKVLVIVLFLGYFDLNAAEGRELASSLP